MCCMWLMLCINVEAWRPLFVAIVCFPSALLTKGLCSGALDLVSGVGGKMDRKLVKNAVEEYEKYHDYFGGNEETRKAKYTDMVNKYYDLASSFYESGWGESFHFANRYKGESLQESIKRYQHFFALQLGLKKGMKVLDVGCGIGGPLREIARFSSASITGLNNNENQIAKGKVKNEAAGLSETCDFVKADFMRMPFPDDTFDAIYGIQSTCHAPDILGCYKEIYRVLKPGQYFAVDEWCLTDHFNPKNESHQKIKAEIELGDGLAEIRFTSQCLDALKQAGFEVKFVKDFALDSPIPWYWPLDTSRLSVTNFHLTWLGRRIAKALLKTVETVGITPAGTTRVWSFLEKAADGLVAGGRRGIFTALFFIVVQKPLQNPED